MYISVFSYFVIAGLHETIEIIRLNSEGTPHIYCTGGALHTCVFTDTKLVSKFVLHSDRRSWLLFIVLTKTISQMFVMVTYLYVNEVSSKGRYFCIHF